MVVKHLKLFNTLLPLLFQINRIVEHVSDSGSESDYGTDDYETVYIECQADIDHAHATTTVPPAGHSGSIKQTSLNGSRHFSNEKAVISHSPSHDLQAEVANPGQSFIQSTRNINSGALPVSDSPEAENVRASNAMTVIGLNNYAAVDKNSSRGIITVWKSYNNGASDNDVTQTEQQPQKIASTTERRTGLCKLPSFEEVGQNDGMLE